MTSVNVQGTPGLAVVIPTTHAVDDVRELVHAIRQAASLSVTMRIVIVDNGPSSTREGWQGCNIDSLVTDKRYLGSEGGFVRGLIEAGSADRYLLLDHDAMLSAQTINEIIVAARKHPKSVVSANQGGNGHGWLVGGSFSDGTSNEVMPVRGAPWSGMLLTPEARSIVISCQSGYFFLWDDYYATWRIRQAGIDVIGLPNVVVHNCRSLDAQYLPWRAYYRARNELLYYRDTGSRGRFRAASMRLRYAMGALRRRRFRVGIAVARGICDGIRNHRGMTIEPGDTAHVR